VKFLLVPLLIVGMFVSFGAALLAMLFWDGTFKSLEDLKEFFMGQVDSTQLSEDLLLREDKLDDLFGLAESYKELYDERFKMLAELEDCFASDGNGIFR
jgi:hypothetical protein